MTKYIVGDFQAQNYSAMSQNEDAKPVFQPTSLGPISKKYRKRHKLVKVGMLDKRKSREGELYKARGFNH